MSHTSDLVGLCAIGLIAAALRSRYGWESAAFFVGGVLLVPYLAREVVTIIVRIRGRA